MTDADVERWKRLPRSRKKALADRVARRRSREWREKYPNVISAGVGYRIHDGGETLSNEICLKFAVSRKRKTARRNDIPKYIMAFTNDGDRRRRVAIPTDVDEFGKGSPDGARDIGDGIFSRPASGGAGSKGAVFCLVTKKGSPSEMYALGCHHVFTRSLKRGGCEPDGDAILVRQDNGITKIGQVHCWADLKTTRLFSMDLAAVLVTNKKGISAMNHGVIPKRRARRTEEPFNYKIHTPRGKISATYVSKQHDVPLQFKCGSITRTFRFATVLQSRADTFPGDSGSPLIGANGTLYGMHFYKTRHFALALPSHQLFAERNLKMEMRLVTRHDP